MTDAHHTVADDVVLWRYMDLWKFISLLRGELYLSSVAALQATDPWENRAPTSE